MIIWVLSDNLSVLVTIDTSNSSCMLCNRKNMDRSYVKEIKKNAFLWWNIVEETQKTEI